MRCRPPSLHIHRAAGVAFDAADKAADSRQQRPRHRCKPRQQTLPQHTPPQHVEIVEMDRQQAGEDETARRALGHPT